MEATVHLGFRAHCSGLKRNLPNYSTFFRSSTRRFNFDPSLKFICRKREEDCGRRGLKVSCERVSAIVENSETARESAEGNEKLLSIVMKFGGSSVASAERMREVADLILSFPDERPVVVLSAMGKTTNNLLLAGEKALCCGVSNTSDIDQLSFIKELHIKTVNELGLDSSIISGLLEYLEQLLKAIAMMKELTLHTKDHLVSFGERMPTRIFAAYLNKIGSKARQDLSIGRRIGSGHERRHVLLG